MITRGTRLIMGFIITVVIAGGILTYMSINSISNFKELTEKKISEEEQLILDDLRRAFQQTLENTATEYRNKRYDIADANKLYPDTFILNADNEFLWPYYKDDAGVYIQRAQDGRYLQEFNRGQNLEFIKRDLKGSTGAYESSLKYANSRVDTSASLNAVARVCIKSGNIDRSLSCYSLIIDEYYDTQDDFGFLFSYYAVNNLLKLNDLNDPKRVTEVIYNFIRKTDEGLVPMNSTTSEIINGIRESEYVFTSKEEESMRYHIDNIEDRLRFINLYAPVIRETLEQNSPVLVAGMILVSEDLPDPADILLIDSYANSPSGFLSCVDSIWSEISIQDIIKNSEFEYVIKLTETDITSNRISSELSLQDLISPYISQYSVNISLSEPGLLNTYVNRRNLAFGIALTMLLGSMVFGVMMILRDILREKKMGILRSDFVSNVTHELKTPLTSIHLMTESILLDRIRSEKDRKEYLNIILRETERLKRMINNILSFSVEEKGTQTYNFKDTDISELIRLAFRDLSYWLTENNFRVETDLEEGLMAKIDADAMKQAVLNLVGNAIKFSGERKEIRVKLWKKVNRIFIQVEDTGIGIPSDEIGLIFNKFYRVEGYGRNDIAGTGLGLTVVKDIIDRHKGEIKVESTLNVGSKFLIILRT